MKNTEKPKAKHKRHIAMFNIHELRLALKHPYQHKKAVVLDKNKEAVAICNQVQTAEMITILLNRQAVRVKNYLASKAVVVREEYRNGKKVK